MIVDSRALSRSKAAPAWLRSRRIPWKSRSWLLASVLAVRSSIGVMVPAHRRVAGATQPASGRGSGIAAILAAEW